MQRQGSQRDAVVIWKQWPLRPSVSIGRTRRPPRSKDFSPRSKYFYCIWHLHQVLNIQTYPTTSLPPSAIAFAPRDYSFDQSVMLLSRIGAMSGRVKMSKFLLTVCAFGQLLSFAFAKEKSPEQHREESNQIGLQKMNWTRVVASGTKSADRLFLRSQPRLLC